MEKSKSLNLLRNSLEDLPLFCSLGESWKHSRRDSLEILIEHGYEVFEVSFRDFELELVKNSDLNFGIRGVNSQEEAQKARELGAKFVSSACFVQELCDWSKKENFLYIPGGMTPSEWERGRSEGMPLQSIFPKDLWTVNSVSDLIKSMPHLKLLQAGVYNSHQVQEFFEAGVFAFDISDYLVANCSDLETLSKESRRWAEFFS